MPLNAGDRLGPYEIVAPLGAGGMGEVYKARDTRLDRSVAVKVLPEHIAQREDARGRFEREARAVASLNHPNICTLHDIGPNYMVMELIEGETLAARIAKAPIPLEQAITFATQIADALDRAHRAGVTHRDIKPGNIMLTRDGVKVLDFGLAKSTAKPGPTEETLTQALTTQGTIVGTPQYMAPEQFEGKEADARSDIWSFGAVLYEMVTGRKAFEGKSYSSLVGAILSADPAPLAVVPFTPAWLERLVRRCLQKDPEDRYHCLRDLVIDLRSPPSPEVAPAPVKSNRWWPAIAAVAVIAAVSFAALWLRQGGVVAALPPVALTVDPPEGATFARITTSGGSAISPDGRTLAFVATRENGVSSLYVRPLDSLMPRALPGTEWAAHPFWSPDSKTLAFFAQNKLKRIEVAGGPPVTLCDADIPRGADWGENGLILFSTLAAQGLRMIPASGGTPKKVTRVDLERGETTHNYPQFLPGGRAFLYVIRGTDSSKEGVAISSLVEGAKEGDHAAGVVAVVLPKNEFRVRHDAASGQLLYIQGDGTLMAQRMELEPVRLTGSPVVVAEGLRWSPGNGYTDFSVSRTGTLFFGQGAEITKVRFGWRDRTGKALEIVGEPVEAWSRFRLSPDGTRVAYYAGPSLLQSDVWVMELKRGSRTRISLNGGAYPLWSPDGKSIYYNSRGRICRKSADGLGEEELLAKGTVFTTLNSVSPDGKTLLSTFPSHLRLALSGSGEAPLEPYPLTNHKSGVQAEFSPDGRWLAYVSNESGRTEIYLQTYPDQRFRSQVSVAGGQNPLWRADGKELYWESLDGKVMAAAIEFGPDGPRPSGPRVLFQLAVTDVRPHFQPSRDGERFLVYEPESGASRQTRMVVIQNWTALLGK